MKLNDAEAGSYSPNTPYSVVRIDFDRLLADLGGGANGEEDGIVNLKDYAILARDWGVDRTGQQPRETSPADISGPNGVPDMKVDIYDLMQMAEQWLMKKEDIPYVSQAMKTIEQVKLNYKINNDFMKEQTEKFYANLENTANKEALNYKVA